MEKGYGSLGSLGSLAHTTLKYKGKTGFLSGSFAGSLGSLVFGKDGKMNKKYLTATELKINALETERRAEKYLDERIKEARKRRPSKVVIRIGRGLPWRILGELDAFTETLGDWGGLEAVRVWVKPEHVDAVAALDGTGELDH